ncbi:MAG: DUF285 domain-containing protein [Thiotrichales bacterium]|nr:DUF285 domain-containing protein [Thiotrichales bacterium]
MFRTVAALSLSGLLSINAMAATQAPPPVEAFTNKVPATGKFELSMGTPSTDKDGDKLTYRYEVLNASGAVVKTIPGTTGTISSSDLEGFTKEVDYTVRLVVSDGKAETSSAVKTFQVKPLPKFYLASNGVTIKCENATVGETGVVNGKTYTAYDTAGLFAIKTDQAKLETACTSHVTSLNAGNDPNWEEIVWEGLFYGSPLNPDISSWDTSKVTNMIGVFVFAEVFNRSLNSWDTSKVENMALMFYQAYSFNNGSPSGSSDNPLTLDTSSLRIAQHVFTDADAFNQPIGQWNVSKVENMCCMFMSNDTFDQDISKWDVSKVSDMSSLFSHALKFNQDISSWNTGSLLHAHAMFKQAKSFNRPLLQEAGKWDVSKVFNFSEMFSGATVFNQDISSWNTGSAKFMLNMFNGAIAFNNGGLSGTSTNPLTQVEGKWNTGEVEYMWGMFENATVFNQDISSWNTSKVQDMTVMFRNAKAFNQNISSWCPNITSAPANFARDATLFATPTTRHPKGGVWSKTCPL